MACCVAEDDFITTLNSSMRDAGENRKETCMRIRALTHPKKSVRVGCWNVRIMYSNGKEARTAEGVMEKDGGKGTRCVEASIMSHGCSLGQTQGQVEASHFWPYAPTWGKGTKNTPVYCVISKSSNGALHLFGVVFSYKILAKNYLQFPKICKL